MPKAVTAFKQDFIIIWDTFYWEKYERIAVQNIFWGSKDKNFTSSCREEVGSTVYTDKQQCTQENGEERTYKKLIMEANYVRQGGKCKVQNGSKILRLFLEEWQHHNKEWVSTFVDRLLDAGDIDQLI